MSCYFIELYLDNLRDLLFAMENPRGSPPKLEIKLDTNKMVVVKNVVVKVGAIGLGTNKMVVAKNVVAKGGCDWPGHEQKWLL